MMMGELLFFLLLDFVQPFRPHYGWQGIMVRAPLGPMEE